MQVRFGCIDGLKFDDDIEIWAMKGLAALMGVRFDEIGFGCVLRV